MLGNLSRPYLVRNAAQLRIAAFSVAQSLAGRSPARGTPLTERGADS